MLKDRVDAGQRLAGLLGEYANQSDVIILALPRGGVPVGFEVAKALKAPFDVFIVRKIGLPEHPELALGAIASGGASHLNEEILNRLFISQKVVDDVVRMETVELRRREKLYRSGRPPLNLKDRRVILNDDGLATGASMLAAVRAMKRMGPKEIIVAVPVVAGASLPGVRSQVDRVVSVLAPDDLHSVGEWYQDFSPTSDEEVTRLLQESTT